jgi:hypothetical protein
VHLRTLNGICPWNRRYVKKELAVFRLCFLKGRVAQRGLHKVLGGMEVSARDLLWGLVLTGKDARADAALTQTIERV